MIEPFLGCNRRIDAAAAITSTMPQLRARTGVRRSWPPGTHLLHAPAPRRKQRLLEHLHGTRQQLLRLLAVVNWKPWKVLHEVVEQDRVLDVAAKHTSMMQEMVDNMRKQAAGRIMTGSYLNMFDVNTALEVLTTGACGVGAAVPPCAHEPMQWALCMRACGAGATRRGQAQGR